MILADSDVLIDALQGKEPATSWFEQALSREEIRTTVVSQFELLVGARNTAARQAIQKLLTSLSVVPFDSPAAEAAADVHRHLGESGRTIGMADSLIAGIAISRGARLATRNRRHFERVPDLTIVDLSAES